MKNARRIVLILALIAVFIILSQRLDQFTGAPATPTSTAGSTEQLAEPQSATGVSPESAYPSQLAAPTDTPGGPYPPPKPTPTPSPEGYQSPTG